MWYDQSIFHSYFRQILHLKLWAFKVHQDNFLSIFSLYSNSLEVWCTVVWASNLGYPFAIISPHILHFSFIFSQAHCLHIPSLICTICVYLLVGLILLLPQSIHAKYSCLLIWWSYLLVFLLFVFIITSVDPCLDCLMSFWFQFMTIKLQLT